MTKATERARTPSAIDAAVMAEFAIGAKEEHCKRAVVSGDWMLVKIYKKRKLKICVYYSKSGREYCVVNPGTVFGVTATCFDNFLNNILQPLGLSWDMRQSIAFAENFCRKHRKQKITFVGHSKGGAEAMANAVATNRNCIVFNPAVVCYKSYGLRKKREQYTASISAYFVEGEFLTGVLQKRQKKNIKDYVMLPAQYKRGSRMATFKNHTMYAVNKALATMMKNELSVEDEQKWG